MSDFVTEGKWDTIQVSVNDWQRTTRMAVPGGWLVCVFHKELFTTTFVPDPHRSWAVIYKKYNDENYTYVEAGGRLKEDNLLSENSKNKGPI